MKHNVYLYILGMWLVTYLIRVLPLTLIRREITNKTIRSFLYYVPYVTLAVMTFPAILTATQSPVSGALALVAGLVLAWLGGSLFQVSVACCAVVFLGRQAPCREKSPARGVHAAAYDLRSGRSAPDTPGELALLRIASTAIP